MDANYSPVITFEWNGTDMNNKPLPSGVYLYQLRLDNKIIETKKMVLTK